MPRLCYWKGFTSSITVALLFWLMLVFADTGILSYDRANLATTTVNNCTFFAGGTQYPESIYSLDVFCQNIMRSIYGAPESLEQQRQGLSATGVGDVVIFAGGFYSDGTLSTDINILNVSATDAAWWRWSQLNFSEPRSWLAATTVNNLALFAGGQTETNVSNRVDIFNITSGIWTVANLSVPRSHLAATTVGEIAFFGGGQDYYGEVFYSTVDIFNITSGKWIISNLSIGRSWLAATTLNNQYAIFAGGTNLTAEFEFYIPGMDIVDIFDIQTQKWSQARLSVPRFALAATSISGYALFGGGRSYSSVSATLDIWELSTNSWCKVKLSEERYALAASSISTVAYFAGGFQNIGAFGSSKRPTDIIDILYQSDIQNFCKPSPPVHDDETNVFVIALISGLVGVVVLVVLIGLLVWHIKRKRRLFYVQIPDYKKQHQLTREKINSKQFQIQY